MKSLFNESPMPSWRIETAPRIGPSSDAEPKPGGSSEIEFENGSKMIINRHTAAREIWVAAKSGGLTSVR